MLCQAVYQLSKEEIGYAQIYEHLLNHSGEKEGEIEMKKCFHLYDTLFMLVVQVGKNYKYQAGSSVCMMEFDWDIKKVPAKQLPVPAVKTKICAQTILEHENLFFSTDSNNQIIVSNRRLEKGPLSVIEIPTTIRKILGGTFQVYFPHYIDNDSCLKSLEGFQKILSKFTSSQFKSAKKLIEDKLKVLEKGGKLDEANPSTSETGSGAKKSLRKNNKKRKIIPAPEKDAGSPAPKRTRSDTISSLSSEEETKNHDQTSPNKKNLVKPGDKPCLPHLLYNTCKYKNKCRNIHDLPGFDACSRHLTFSCKGPCNKKHMNKKRAADLAYSLVKDLIEEHRKEVKNPAANEKSSRKSNDQLTTYYGSPERPGTSRNMADQDLSQRLTNRKRKRSGKLNIS